MIGTYKRLLTVFKNSLKSFFTKSLLFLSVQKSVRQKSLQSFSNMFNTGPSSSLTQPNIYVCERHSSWLGCIQSGIFEDLDELKRSQDHIIIGIIRHVT